MERTISVMVGKGSLNHNNRQFVAKNVNADRIKDNVVFVRENIRNVYHELFDEAVSEYNAGQKRNDRKITDYYKKIQSDKAKKTFHETVVQLGNMDDTACGTKEGELAAEILSEYMEGFQERNPNLRVFNAVLHMDEASPHLHIDYVPFTRNAKRGPKVQVSMKQALKELGFVGTGINDTEWKRWAENEKKVLASIMEKYEVRWLQKGTHEEHLDVLDYKKKKRTEEVQELKTEIDTQKGELRDNRDTIVQQKRKITGNNRLIEIQAKVKRERQAQLEEQGRRLDFQKNQMRDVNETLAQKEMEAVRLDDEIRIKTEELIDTVNGLADKSTVAVRLDGEIRDKADRLQEMTDRTERLKSYYEALDRELESDYQKRKADYERDMAVTVKNMESDYNLRQSELQREYEKKNKELAAGYDEKSKLLEEDYEDRVKKLASDYAEKNNALEVDYADRIKALKARYETKNNLLDSDFCQRKTMLDNELARRKELLENDYVTRKKELDEELATKHNELNNANRELAGKNEELAAVREDIRTEWEELKVVETVANIQFEEINKKTEEAMQKQKQIKALCEEMKEAYFPSMRERKLSDEILALRQKVMRLEIENNKLKEKLQQAYDFMKTLVINGRNAFEEFLDRIEERVRDTFVKSR